MNMSENLFNIITIENNTTSKSAVRQYFKRVQVNGVYRAQCLIGQCPSTLSIPTGSTSPLFKHLKTVHQMTVLKKKFNGRVIEGRVIPKLTKEKKKKLDHLALAAIVKDGRSFNDFHKSGIKQFLDAAIPGNKEILLSFFTTLVTEDFQSQSTVLQFSTFDQRHYSHLIGREIEKQLINLNIFHNVTTITSDNAPNMVALFQHLTRPVGHIPCMAHIIHLILCNALGIWVTKKVRKSFEQSNNDNPTDGFDNDLSQSVDTMDIDRCEQLTEQSSEEENDSENEVNVV